MSSKKLSTDEIRQWREDGIVCLRGVFDQGWMDVLETGFENACRNPSALAKDYAKDGKGSFLTDHGMYRRVEELHNFIFESPAAELAAGLMGADAVNLIDDHLLLKEPERIIPPIGIKTNLTSILPAKILCLSGYQSTR